jgi:hypothetical protein
VDVHIAAARFRSARTAFSRAIDAVVETHRRVYGTSRVDGWALGFAAAVARSYDSVAFTSDPWPARRARGGRKGCQHQGNTPVRAMADRQIARLLSPLRAADWAPRRAPKPNPLAGDRCAPPAVPGRAFPRGAGRASGAATMCRRPTVGRCGGWATRAATRGRGPPRHATRTSWSVNNFAIH